MEWVMIPLNCAIVFGCIYKVVELFVHKRESQRRQQVGAVIIVAAVAVLGIGGLAYAFGAVIWQSLVTISKQPDALALALPTLFCLAFFVLLNQLLARHYVHKGRTSHA